MIETVTLQESYHRICRSAEKPEYRKVQRYKERRLHHFPERSNAMSKLDNFSELKRNLKKHFFSPYKAHAVK